MLPPLPPSWDGYHPLLVHFPIGLLPVAAVLVAVGLIWFSQHRSMFIAALIVMAIGTAGAFLAVSTGEAAHDATKHLTQFHDAVEEHEELAELARTLFAILTVVFAALVIAPRLMKREISRRIVTICGIVFLCLWMAACTVLFNASHQGGLLVHELGIQGRIAPPGSAEVHLGEPSD